jgi:hypothetical protein
MSTVMLSTALARTGLGLVGGGLIPLLLVFGLLLAPVSCMCGASVPHGHSLFQLPHHNHSAVDHDHHGYYTGQRHEDGFVHHTHPLMAVDLECEDPGGFTEYTGNFALSNAMEHQDGAIVQAPPSSSFGQPMVIAQPSLPTTVDIGQCEPLNLPSTRTLEGLATSPETPPPRA